MLDYLANWRKSDEEKRQETITAYLDDALAPKQKRLFEEQTIRCFAMMSSNKDT